MTLSPGEKRLDTAAAMAPEPEQDKDSTGCSVPNSTRRPFCTRAMISLKAGLRWWIMSRAMARRTSSGMGVGPGVSRRILFSMGFCMDSSIVRQKEKISLVLARGKMGDGRAGGALSEV